MKKILPILFFLFTIISVTITANNTIIEGKILENKKTVPSIPISLSSTENKTLTNKKGSFRIESSDPEKDTLIVSFAPENTLRIPLNGANDITIQLKDDTTFVRQNIKKHISASYGGTIVTRQSLEQTGEINLLRAIAAKVAGVEYINGNLIIRGVGTIKLSTNPLYLIDKVQTYDASYLTVQEVESVEVVKDASTSMFGMKGANGVVIINLR